MMTEELVKEISIFYLILFIFQSNITLSLNFNLLLGLLQLCVYPVLAGSLSVIQRYNTCYNQVALDGRERAKKR